MVAVAAGVEDLEADACRLGPVPVPVPVPFPGAAAAAHRNPDRVDRVGDDPVPLHLGPGAELGGEGGHPPGAVGADPTRNHEAAPALGPGAEVLSHGGEAVVPVAVVVTAAVVVEEGQQEPGDGMSLEAGVHRPHDAAVGEGSYGRPQRQRLEEVRVVRGAAGVGGGVMGILVGKGGGGRGSGALAPAEGSAQEGAGSGQRGGVGGGGLHGAAVGTETVDVLYIIIVCTILW